MESGPNGVTWAVNRVGYIYYRAGISKAAPTGRRWVLIPGKLSFVTVGCTGVYGVSNQHEVWRYRGKLPALSFSISKLTGINLYCYLIVETTSLALLVI